MRLVPDQEWGDGPELQELGSWKSVAMVKRYAQLRVKHLTPAAGLIDRVLPADALLAVARWRTYDTVRLGVLTDCVVTS
jgi:hypothetical protein